MTPTQTAQDINHLSSFLSDPQLPSLPLTFHPTTKPTPTTLIVAPSALLHQAHTLFTHLQTHFHSSSQSSSLKTLILTGGHGHSTRHLYTAIHNSKTYHTLPQLLNRPNNDLTGLSESRLWYLLFIHFHDGADVIKSWNGGAGLTVLIEEESTNCGANASLSKGLLEEHGVYLDGKGGKVEGEAAAASGNVEDVVIVQDPTMSLRTKASFEKVYGEGVEAGRLRFWCWPVFVPVVRVGGDGVGIVWDAEGMGGIDVEGLWDMKRFYGLILGEIARLRDDEGGYGPKGKGFIVHVDVPEEVEQAWRRLNRTLEFQR